MAKKEPEKRYCLSNFRFGAHCTHCKRTWESDDLADMPENCDQCGRSVMVNDHATIKSRFKSELEDEE